MATYTVSVEQYLDSLAAPNSPGDNSYVIEDTAANIESLTPYDLSAATGVNAISGIVATDGSVELTVDQALVLEADQVPVSAPTGDAVTISDTESSIQTLSPDQLVQLSSIGIAGFAANDLVPTSVSSYVAGLDNSSGSVSPPATFLNVTDSASNIETLKASQLDEARSAGLGQLTSTDGSVVLTVDQALALESQIVRVAVPVGDKVIIADTAATVESLTSAQIALFSSIGVNAIAGTDAPPVFDSAQMTALSKASVAVTAPPNDPTQVYSDPIITNPNGGGLTFDISFDSSVASAPASFIPAMDAAFQFYANLFENPITLYYTVGWGEYGGNTLSANALGENQPNAFTGESYSSLKTITGIPFSLAEQEAWNGLPQPANVSGSLELTTADYQALSLTDDGSMQGSFSNPDDQLGIASNYSQFSYVTDPTQVPSNEVGIVGTAEHEISEGMGRFSALANFLSASYEFIDLFRYSAPGVHQLGTGAPSYFSIDGGVTDLDNWNNYQTGNNGDLADWAPSAGQDAYDDNAQFGPDPVTPTDILLMNVLGYKVNPTQYFTASQIENMTSATITFWSFVGVLDFAASDASVILTAAQALLFEGAQTLSYEASSVEITAPAGDYVVVADYAAYIEALTPAQITALKAIGVTAIGATDASLALDVAQIDAIEGAKLGLSVPTGDTITIQDNASNIEGLTAAEITKAAALGVTGITSTDASVNITVAQASALENASIAITVPTGDTVTLDDKAAPIEGLTASEINGLVGIGVSVIHATDNSVALSLAQAVALESAPLDVTVPGGDTVTVADTAANITSLTLDEIAGLPAIGVSGITVTDASVTITLYQAEALEAASLTLKPPSGDTVTVFDQSDGGGIQRMTPAQILALPSISATTLSIDVNDLPETINVADALALETVGVTLFFPFPESLNFPYVYDTASNLGLLTPAQIAALPAIGFRALWASDPSDIPQGLPLSVAQAVALENASLFVRGVSVFAPVIDLVDSAANIEALTPVQILKLPQISRGQTGFFLPESGPINVTSTGQPLGISVTQLQYFHEAGLQFIFSVQGGGAVTISDTAENISLFLINNSQTQLDQYKTDGFAGVAATDTSLGLLVSSAVKLENAGMTASAPAGDSVTILDFGTDIETLTAPEISLLPTIGVTGISSPFSSVQLSVAQAAALEEASLAVTVTPGSGYTVTLDDTVANLETLTPSERSGLTAIGVTALGIVDTAANIEALTPSEIATLKSEGLATITATDASVALNASQAVALEDPVYVTAPAGDSVTLSDNVSNVLGLTAPDVAGLGSIGVIAIAIVDTASDIEALTTGHIAALGADKVTNITATDASVNLDVAQTLALEAYAIVVRAPTGDNVAVMDTAANIETLTPTELGALPAIGVTEIAATNAGLHFTIAQAQTLATSSLEFSVPAGDGVTLQDQGANIVALLDNVVLNGDTGQISAITEGLGVSSIVANDGQLTITAVEAGALVTSNTDHGQNIALGSQGDGVIIQDSAADLENMSQTDWQSLSAIGVTAIDVTDASITLTVAQALALYDPIPITVPSGDSVYVAGSESDIASLTPAQIRGLASIGVRVFEVNSSLSGGNLTIDGGVTLSLSQAVPANETITFAGFGGTLALSQDAPGTDVAGTIYGFSPPDTIDLTDVAYDPINGSAELSSDPNNGKQAIEVDENGNSYYLDIDPSQYFLTSTSFTLNQDAAGTGTDLTVTEQPVFGYTIDVPGGATVDGVVIQFGDVEVLYGATANRTIIESGTLTADSGSTVNDTFIGSGGVLDLNYANSATGTITFDAADVVPGESVTGGTLKIDYSYQLSATIDGFAIGDVIDLANIGFSSPHSAVLGAGNQLQVTVGGNVYVFDFDPAQNFSGEYFALTSDNNGGTDIALTGLDSWVGPSAKKPSGDWNTAGNWSAGIVPSGEASIAGSKTYTVTSDQSNTIGNLLLKDAAATLDIAAGTFAIAGLSTDTNAGKIAVADGAALQLTGVFTNNGTIAIDGTGDATSLIVAGHVTLKGKGQVTFGDATGNAIVSNGATATLTNLSTIAGSGTIGDPDLTLTNASTGVIDATGTAALTIASAHTFKNQGMVETTGNGGLTIEGPVLNTGTLAASAGDLTVTGNVTGTGSETIGDNATMTLDAHAAAGQTVMFTGSTGTLALALGQGFAGTVAGFAMGDAIDLENFAYSTSAKKLAISGVTTKGSDTVITIKDGGLTATIALFNQTAGEFGTSASDYTLSSDEHTGKAGTLFQLAASSSA